MRFVQSVLNIMILISRASTIILGILLVAFLVTESDVLVPILSNILHSVSAEKKLAYLFAFIISGLVWLVSYGFQTLLKRIVRIQQ